MVYKTEYTTRRVVTGEPRQTVTSYSYSYNPIHRRRAKPVIISSRVVRTPYAAPLGDQQLLNLLTTPTVTRTRQYVGVDPPTGIDDNSTSYSRTFSSTSSTSGTGGRDRADRDRHFDTDSFFDRSASSSSSSFPSGGNNTSTSRTFSKKTETRTTDDGSGPKTYSYTTESTRNDGGPGSLFTSTTTKRGPDGVRLKHYSFK